MTDVQMKGVKQWARLFAGGAAAVGIFAVLGVVYLADTKGDNFLRVKLIVAYELLVLLFFFGLIVLIEMSTGSIDLSNLLSDGKGEASMSRFQLMIFTFTIAFSFLFLVVCSKDCTFPAVPKEVLELLGISATTYGIGKGISASNDSGGKDPAAPPEVPQSLQPPRPDQP